MRHCGGMAPAARAATGSWRTSGGWSPAERRASVPMDNLDAEIVNYDHIETELAA
jgi:hypothetical protein